MTERRVAVIVACTVTVITITRIAATYPVFSETYDEPSHLASGMEWIGRGTYLEDTGNPPLAKIAIAFLPWIDGARMPPVSGNRELANYTWHYGNEILYDGGHHWRVLTLARCGILPFLLLAIAVTFAWARRLYGDAAAAVAVVLLTSVTPVLGLAGLATTDLAVAATVAAAMYAIMLCLEAPTPLRALIAGLAIAAACLTKFSAAAFIGLPAVVILLWARPRMNVAVPAIVVVTIIAAVMLIYRFQWYPLKLGLLVVRYANAVGYEQWFLGHTNRRGWWYYFPVLFAVKTPLGFAILAAIGCGRDLAARVWQRAVAPLSAIAILGIAMRAHLNIGLRHILPMYPLLAVSAAGAFMMLWRSRRRFVPLFAAACMAWEVIATAAVHPDYLAAFNELAGGHPERIAVDSNLDWGQDVARLGDTVRQFGIHRLWFACHFTGRAGMLVPAQLFQLPPRRPVVGWIAVSETAYRGIDIRDPDAYVWLDAYRPVLRVGQSIRLYFIRPSGAPP